MTSQTEPSAVVTSAPGPSVRRERPARLAGRVPIKLLRLSFLLAALTVLAWGAFRELHRVWKLDSDNSVAVYGPGFTEGATYEAFMLKDGRLYDAYGLAPESASIKDCKT